MRRATVRLHMTLALLAWFAQLCLPMAHAALMAGAPSKMPRWCGQPSRAMVLAIAAELPPELREALVPNATGADHHLACAEFCAACSTPPPVAVAATVLLRAAGIEPEPAPPILATPRSREQARTPPSQAPPAQA